MEESQQLNKKKIITLIGRLKTPIILRKPFYKKHGCWIRVTSDPLTDRRPTFVCIGKLVKDEYKAPTSLRGYRGYVKVTCAGVSVGKLKQKISTFIQKGFLGSLTAEGYGRITWEKCLINEFQQDTKILNKKLRIRKGLGINYPPELQRLLIALMLHDFVHTEKHPSKIFQQITIEDVEIREACLNHHNSKKLNNRLHHAIQYYDSLASYISRRKPHKTVSRYDKINGRIDFKRLAEEIERVQHSAYKLYNYIHHSKELTRTVESFEYGKNPLRNHLLLMVNLAINDYYDKKLVIKKGKIIIERKDYKEEISTTTSEREELVTVKDAEMHSIPDHE
jgi:hypothetical protein